MASIIPGYEYDIFISYRQKDNKHDGWVTEFVNQLKGELESTFKEEISVYFDINPHDGLLETHDVGESLKDKLKCLVFIPIISRTYCDPKSFAWEHEFKAFVEQASKDQIGLKVKLLNGNVSNRVLPVRIHNLDIADIKECESVLGGVLRGIEFIYKESGIDKPLTVDDDEKKNLNNTKYRIQIIKVAHAIKEIFQGMKPEPDTLVKGKPHLKESMDDDKNEDIRKAVISKGIINQRSKKLMILLLSLLFCVVGAFAIFKIIQSSKPANDIANLEKSIAVLPFKNMSNDPAQEYFSDGMKEEILNHLFKIGGLKIPSGTSTMRFKDSKLSVQEIARELNVSYVLEGNVSKSDNNVRIIVRLINGKNGELVWTEDYRRSMTATDILEIQSDVALEVANNLKIVIDPEVKKRIKTRSTENTEAYSLYLQSTIFNIDSFPKAIKLLERAVNLDPNFADAYAAMAYWRMWYMGDSLSREQILEEVEPLLNKALQLDNTSVEAHNALAELRMWYYWDLEAVEKELQIFRQLNPANTDAFYGFTQYLWVVGRAHEAYTICKNSFEQNETTPYNWIMMSIAYSEIGDQEKALETIESALRLFPDDSWVNSHALGMFTQLYRYEDAIEVFVKYYADRNITDLEDDILGPMGIAFFKTGNKSKANTILKELLSRNRNFARNQSFGIAASIYVAMGEKDKALQCLDKAYTRHELDLVGLKHYPEFKPLHGNPQFENLLLKIGLK